MDDLYWDKLKGSITDDRYDKFYQSKYPDSISNIRNNIAHQLKDREEYSGRDIEKLQIFLVEFEKYFAIKSSL